MQNAVVSSNRVLAATGNGGGVSNNGNGTVTISNSTVENNNRAGTGGGYADTNVQASLSVTGNAFLTNIARGDGSAIAAWGPMSPLRNGIDSNSSSAFGRELYSCGTATTVSQSVFANNSAARFLLHS